jgi:hypothetical protein
MERNTIWATITAVAILSSLAYGGDAHEGGQATDVAALLRKQVEIWDGVATGNIVVADFDHSGFRELIQRVGTERVREAAPDLLHLLNNVSYSESFTAEYAILALRSIRDERAIVPLLGEMRWWNNASRTIDSLDALLAFRAPVCPQITLALKSDEEIHVRRSLWTLRILAQGVVNERLDVKLSTEEKLWFAVSDDAIDAVQRLFTHQSLTVRFEAGVTWLMIRAQGLAELKKLLGTDKSASIQLLLDKPDELMDSRILGGVRDDRSSSLLGQARDAKSQDDAYRHVSDWAALGKDLSMRVTLTRVSLDFHEPVYDLNEPLWVRLEVRNDGVHPITLDLDRASGQPMVYPALHDCVGVTAVMGAPKVIVDTFRPAPTIVLQPKAVYSREFEFLHDIRLVYDGDYTIRPMTENSPVLLTLKVTGLPRPLWEPQHRPFGYNRKTICYPRFNVPSGPANVYRDPATLPPPAAPIHTTTPIAIVDTAGNSHVYYEPFPNAYVLHGPAERKLIDPKFLAYVQSYHEVVTSAGGRLMKWLRYEKAALVESISYDDHERIRLHVHHDRHENPNRGTSIEYTATGKTRRRVYLSGTDLHSVQSFEYRYDDQDRRVKEERYDAAGKMTDYFLLDPDKQQHNNVWYERFSSNGTPVGTGWISVD